MKIAQIMLGLVICGSTIAWTGCISEGVEASAARSVLVRVADDGNPPQIQIPEQQEEELEQQQQQQQQQQGGGGGGNA